MTMRHPLVSIIISTYYRPDMLREAVASICVQTYENIEIVIVNNGATYETVEYLLGLEKEEERVRLVHFETNQFSWNDIGMTIRVCFNAGLRASKGELVFYLEDDDWLAADFIERMVKLFAENPECTTAIGRCINAMPDGKLVPYDPANRPRYLPGHELALDCASGSKNIRQLNPGFCFVMKKDELERNGGFHETFEAQQMFAIVPFGVTGYDPDALMYWRRHESQLNKQANARGFYWGQYIEGLLVEPRMNVLERWASRFGKDNARTIEIFLLRQCLENYLEILALNVFRLRLLKAFVIFVNFRKIKATKVFSKEIMISSFKSSARMTLLGRNLLYISMFINMFCSDPRGAIKKSKEKLFS